MLRSGWSRWPDARNRPILGVHRGPCSARPHKSYGRQFPQYNRIFELDARVSCALGWASGVQNISHQGREATVSAAKEIVTRRRFLHGFAAASALVGIHGVGEGKDLEKALRGQGSKIALGAKRYDDASGKAVFSGTVPFLPGQLQ